MKKFLALLIIVSIFFGNTANAASKKIASKGSIISDGSTYKFGKYEGTIEWIVLHIDAEENRALLLSNNILFYAPYNVQRTSVTWETCSLRKFLNKDFYNRCFNSKERTRILDTTLLTDRNITTDKIFLLSLPELRDYLPEEESRRCSDLIPESFFISRNPPMGRNSWWLRSPGETASKALRVAYSGSVHLAGQDVNWDNGVRPALWLSLSEKASGKSNKRTSK